MCGLVTSVVHDYFEPREYVEVSEEKEDKPLLLAEPEGNEHPLSYHSKEVFSYDDMRRLCILLRLGFFGGATYRGVQPYMVVIRFSGRTEMERFQPRWVVAWSKRRFTWNNFLLRIGALVNSGSSPLDQLVMGMPADDIHCGTSTYEWEPLKTDTYEQSSHHIHSPSILTRHCTSPLSSSSENRRKLRVRVWWTRI
jgi:hypothetical protein